MARRRLSIPRLRIGTGFKLAREAGYTKTDFRHDILAGLTVGTVAVPLSMALAIATGVAPQHGLYTAIVAGLLIALTGGTRYNVSGPTAAFVVILFPVVQQYGLGGLLIASLMAGIILIILGVSRMGRLISFIPYPVVLGFTAGIAVVIAVLQVPDFLGLLLTEENSHFIDNVSHIMSRIGTTNPYELGVGLFSLVLMLLWPRTKLPLPAPLIGLIAGAGIAYLLNSGFFGQEFAGSIATISSSFTWEAQGKVGAGIPPMPPSFLLPWNLPGPNGEPLQVDFALIRALLGPAFAISVLAAIESLLCAVIADGLTKTKHDPNAELIGQGIGNVVTPFFGGITATAAIARTATSIRSGARSPVAAITHSIVVLLAVALLADVLGLVPMTTLAALLFIVAWNMSEARHFAHTVRSAPAGDVLVLITCFGLTVIFDMVVAVAVGVGIASALFIRRMAEYTHTSSAGFPADIEALPKTVAVYDVNGPLFFGAAEKAISSLKQIDSNVAIVILDMSDVPSVDASAIVALESLIEDLAKQGIAMILVGLTPRIIVKLRRAGIQKQREKLTYTRNITEAAQVARRWCANRDCS
ncbi:C4-dicarboxylic acid transporter DauA [Aliidiomarina quisquiliarum]|uniref:C4-dicarboxylic acid transporter DauA n=1 Tax=Aliidiomarina quisquiliarum TaxID=2938947 RepID=UPI00208ED646|nr:C4-dicarboxylic acid transporter DauA [Aliidiomarina quisquiliarum]MCO4320558.1 C4-dicarboxylic acid transporter DauA [Aliidiomarina quisquiliarum]